ncbi:MAG: chloride channel protein [Pseudomonadota bacterium]
MIRTLSNYLAKTRTGLAGKQALFALSILGILSGIAVGLVVSLFRYCIELPQTFFLPDGLVENYEALSAQSRLILVITGGCLLSLLFYFSSRIPLRVGVIHVLERLTYNEGYLPLKNLVMQFVGGVIAIVSGQSVGREGPSVHLGAATSSLLGQYLYLPNNCIRTLVGCGAAAAIAAAFNTPLAGVIFAMEVILMEYTIAGFAPIILSAVSATAISQLLYENEFVFDVKTINLQSLMELPLIVLMGIVIGGIAAIFIKSCRYFSARGQRLHICLRMILASIAVGMIAIVSPEIMGIGYDTVNLVLIGQIGVASLLLILLAKLLATSICIGFNIPGGLIGPSLFMGAMVGGLMAQAMDIAGASHSGIALYALLGMGAMMSATLHAPLASLLALLELSGSHSIIFPAMLAVVSAHLAAQELFKSESIFLSQFKQLGLDYRNDPVSQHLRRVSLESVLNPAFVVTVAVIDRKMAMKLLQESPDWILIKRNEELTHVLLPATDLARYLENDESDQIDLMDIPAKRRELASVSIESTLQHAQELMNQQQVEALYAITRLGKSADRINGVITAEDIEKQYRF